MLNFNCSIYTWFDPDHENPQLCVLFENNEKCDSDHDSCERFCHMCPVLQHPIMPPNPDFLPGSINAILISVYFLRRYDCLRRKPILCFNLNRDIPFCGLRHTSFPSTRSPYPPTFCNSGLLNVLSNMTKLFGFIWVLKRTTIRTRQTQPLSPFYQCTCCLRRSVHTHLVHPLEQGSSDVGRLFPAEVSQFVELVHI